MDSNCRLLLASLFVIASNVKSRNRSQHQICIKLIRYTDDRARARREQTQYTQTDEVESHFHNNHAKNEKIKIINNSPPTVWSRKRNPPAFVQALIRFLVMPYLVWCLRHRRCRRLCAHFSLYFLCFFCFGYGYTINPYVRSKLHWSRQPNRCWLSLTIFRRLLSLFEFLLFPYECGFPANFNDLRFVSK